MLLERFISGGRIYTFPPQASMSDNFGDLVQRTQRLPGLSGGWRHAGSYPSGSEIGNIRVDFWLKADRPDLLQAALDELYRVRTFGLGRLYMRPLGSEVLRWVDCEVSSIQGPMAVRQRPDMQRRIQMTFQAPDPFWNEDGSEGAWTWGGGTLWGSGSLWGDTAPVRSLPSTSNTFTESVPGAAITYPRMTLTVPAGASCTNPKIQRLESTTVVDEVAWTGTLNAGDSLEVNARTLSVMKNGTSAYSSSFTWLNASWMRLYPGDNSMRVTFTSVTNTPTLTMRYNTRY